MAEKKRLLVEDNDHYGFVSGIAQHHFVWSREKPYTVYVDVTHSAEEALEALSVSWKASRLETLGILLDCDDKFASRWARLTTFCADHNLGIPASMPKTGLILSANGKKFGAWIMPDNGSEGMLESLCNKMLPDGNSDLWKFTEEAALKARQKGAKWRDVHKEKSQLHSWLAWQDPPGESIGNAMNKKIFDPDCDSAKDFLAWLRDLFDLQALP